MSARDSFRLPPPSQEYLLSAIRMRAGELRGSTDAVAAIHDMCLTVWQGDLSPDRAARKLAERLDDAAWSWDVGRAYLAGKLDDASDGQDLLNLFFTNVQRSAYNLFRADQIKALHSVRPYVEVRVLGWNASSAAPCGLRGQSIYRHDDPCLRGRTPPCGHLECSCTWHALNDRDVARKRGTS